MTLLKVDTINGSRKGTKPNNLRKGMLEAPMAAMQILSSLPKRLPPSAHPHLLHLFTPHPIAPVLSPGANVLITVVDKVEPTILFIPGHLEPRLWHCESDSAGADTALRGRSGIRLDSAPVKIKSQDKTIFIYGTSLPIVNTDCTRIGLIAASTIFINSKPLTAYYNDRALEGTLGWTVNKHLPIQPSTHTGLKALTDRMQIKAKGNVLLFDGDNSIDFKDRITEKESEIYARLNDDGPLVRVLGGVKNLALDTDLPLHGTVQLFEGDISDGDALPSLQFSSTSSSFTASSEGGVFAAAPGEPLWKSAYRNTRFKISLV
jgi:hypothetical protein